MKHGLWNSIQAMPFVLDGQNLRIPYGVMVFDVTNSVLRIGDGCRCGGVGTIPVTPNCPPKEMKKAKEKAIKTQAELDLIAPTVTLKK